MADIIKVAKQGGYSLMSNFHLKDKRLSWNAKGLLSAMLSLSGEHTLDELAQLTSNGIRDTEAGVVELEQHGYLTWSQRGDISGVPEIEYTIYEQPVIRKISPDNEAEHPDAEDMPGKPFCSQNDGEGDREKLRERLNIKALFEKCSDNFVEAVFRELCRRDAEFRRRITARAFEYVCLAVWERQQSEPIHTLPILINTYFDNIMQGIRSASGGSESIGCRETGERL